MKPVLSVVVPSYNVEDYLERGLSSYCDERFKGRLEVIIVNDGSSDRTHDIASEFVDRFPDIFVLIDKENGGHGSAVNRGILYAAGEYFRIIDGDDWVNTEGMAMLLDYLEKSKADMVIDNKREVHMVTGAEEYFAPPKSVEFGRTYRFEDICLDPTITPNIMIHTMSIRTKILRENNIRLLEGIFYVDIEYIIKSTIKAKTVEFTDFEVYQYLVGNQNQSVNFMNYVKRFSHHSQVTRELVRFASETPVDSVIMRRYLDRRVILLINTHMNIALIYDIDRNRGIKRAKDFRKYLLKTNQMYFLRTTPRYIVTLILHYCGVNYGKLQRLMGRKA